MSFNAHYALNVACLPFHHFGGVPRILHQALTRSPQKQSCCRPPSAVIPDKFSALALTVPLTISGISHQCDVTRSLDCDCQRMLMTRAIATDAAGQDFAALGDEFFQFVRIFVVYKVHFVCTESACLAASRQCVLIVPHSLLKPLSCLLRMEFRRRKRRWHLNLRLCLVERLVWRLL